MSLNKMWEVLTTSIVLTINIMIYIQRCQCMKINKELCLKRLVSPAPTYADAKPPLILIC